MELGPLGHLPASLQPPRTPVPAQGFSDYIDGLAPVQGSPAGVELPDPGSLRLGPSAPVAGRDAHGSLLRPLEDFLGEVNTTLNTAGDLQERLVAGDDVDFHDVMVASEKGSVALQLTMQIRNRLLEAYQEVARMQV
ncbi:MAG: flagellar hook-basal body complex protein FliE [Candidatus Sericytochromatia bacterium]|nr:flagellar hook-basal body complex protein FliE [Candidatus Sericytochromatia bacterium]